MGFVSVKNNLISFLTAQAESSFTVVGYQPPPQNSEGITKQLSVRYLKGQNPKDINSMSSDIEHLVTFELTFTVIVDASANLAVIDDSQSTTVQIATAIANISSANKLADDTIDSFYSEVLKIIMSPMNQDLGNSENVISSRWLEGFEKSEIFEEGETAVVYGRSYLTLNTDETMEEEESAELEVIDGQITTEDINGENEDTFTQTLIEENY
jgi:hypothetical protein